MGWSSYLFVQLLVDAIDGLLDLSNLGNRAVSVEMGGQLFVVGGWVGGWVGGELLVEEKREGVWVEEERAVRMRWEGGWVGGWVGDLPV